MGVHIGAQKHANCFDQVFLGSSILSQSTSLMRNQHFFDVIIVMFNGGLRGVLTGLQPGAPNI